MVHSSIILCFTKLATALLGQMQRLHFTQPEECRAALRPGAPHLFPPVFAAHIPLLTAPNPNTTYVRAQVPL